MRVIPPRTLVLYCLLIMLIAVPSHGAGKPRIAAPNAPPTFNATITPNPLTLPGPAGNSKQVTVTTTVDPAFGAVIVYSFSGFPNFITNDGPLLAMCERLRAEYGMPIDAMRIEEYVSRRQPDG